MELFPAASTEKWNLIRRVIDECDYYFVIIAGRYGSRGSDGRSYTEMEFDYAIETEKPVIGFYHEDILDLPGSKLEKTDAGKESLLRFTEKVKTKVCRPWRSPEALGSAVKSAVFHEIEFNPQPGWIRATSQADPALIIKLKQRIADLESQIEDTKSQVKKGQYAPAEDELIEVEFEVHSQATQPHPENRWHFDQNNELRSVQVPWPILFAPLGVKLKKPRSLTDIGAMLKLAAIKHSNFKAHEAVPEGFELKSVHLAKAFKGKILDRLIADKLIQEIRTTKRDGWRTKKVHLFQLTQKGLHLAATLRATTPS